MYLLRLKLEDIGFKNTKEGLQVLLFLFQYFCRDVATLRMEKKDSALIGIFKGMLIHTLHVFIDHWITITFDYFIGAWYTELPS